MFWRGQDSKDLRMHVWSVWYICLLIYHTNQPNVGKYTSPMDPLG